MTPGVLPAAPVAQLEAKLASGADREDFDMRDAAELPLLTPFPVLHGALEFLAASVAPLWFKADCEAKRHQKRHTWLARTAVATGTGAIVLAVVQLGLKQSWASLTHTAGLLEGIIVLAGVASVIMGHLARSDRKWLGYRHRAECLRMLKFRALANPTLWSGNVEGWRRWVEEEIKKLPAAGDFRGTEAWSRQDRPESEEPEIRGVAASPDSRQALTTYYKHKRLLNQQEYFRRRGAAAQASWTVRWRDHRLWLFVVTIGCVLFHFGADSVAVRLGQQNFSETARAWEMASLWGIVLAVILPIVGIGVRAWSAAFELSRKARSFDAKRAAMEKAAQRLGGGTEDLSRILKHMAHDELFLEQEHREWLRLLLDAEWFL